MKTRNEIIRDYFLNGLSYDEILSLLSSIHNVKITLRQLNRILRLLNLYRRHGKSPLNVVIKEVAKELKGPSSSYGYRQMHQQLRKNGLVVDKETTRLIIKSLDPEKVAERKRKRLTRRVYVSHGPNNTWHMDGYDKMKPFGFAIHGAIDGYSRKILWLNVASSNNDPKIIASYFINCVKELEIIPQLLRADRGSENVIAGGIQRFMRRRFTDSLAGHGSFRYGPSTRNQRIEAWWSQFRKSRGNWWINFFKDLLDSATSTGIDVSIGYHLECLRFCFMGLIQQELDQVKTMWNHHRIRNVRNSECPNGRPEVLYHASHLSGGRNCGFSITRSDIILAKSFCMEPSLLGCSEEFMKLANVIMKENGLKMPENADEGKRLAEFLLHEIELL